MAYQRTEQTAQRLADKRARILKAARDLVADGGWSAAQIDQVAVKAGVATGTVYRYWPSKAELCAEIVATVSAREVGVVQRDSGRRWDAGREARCRHPHFRQPRPARPPARLRPDRRARRSRSRDRASRLSRATRAWLRAHPARGNHARRLPAARSRGRRRVHRRRLHGGAGRAACARQGRRSRAPIAISSSRSRSSACAPAPARRRADHERFCGRHGGRPVRAAAVAAAGRLRHARGHEPGDAVHRSQRLYRRPIADRNRRAREHLLGSRAADRGRRDGRQRARRRAGARRQPPSAGAPEPRPLRQPDRRDRVPPGVARADVARDRSWHALAFVDGAAARRACRARDAVLSVEPGRERHLLSAGHDLFGGAGAAPAARTRRGVGAVHPLDPVRPDAGADAQEDRAAPSG